MWNYFRRSNTIQAFRKIATDVVKVASIPAKSVAKSLAFFLLAAGRIDKNLAYILTAGVFVQTFLSRGMDLFAVPSNIRKILEIKDTTTTGTHYLPDRSDMSKPVAVSLIIWSSLGAIGDMCSVFLGAVLFDGSIIKNNPNCTKDPDTYVTSTNPYQLEYWGFWLLALLSGVSFLYYRAFHTAKGIVKFRKTVTGKKTNIERLKVGLVLENLFTYASLNFAYGGGALSFIIKLYATSNNLPVSESQRELFAKIAGVIAIGIGLPLTLGNSSFIFNLTAEGTKAMFQRAKKKPFFSLGYIINWMIDIIANVISTSIAIHDLIYSKETGSVSFCAFIGLAALQAGPYGVYNLLKVFPEPYEVRAKKKICSLLNKSLDLEANVSTEYTPTEYAPDDISIVDNKIKLLNGKTFPGLFAKGTDPESFTKGEGTEHLLPRQISTGKFVAAFKK